MSFNDRLKIYYDAEFTSLEQNSQLLSIGLLSESGAFFYAEFTDYDNDNISCWLKENVIKNMLFDDNRICHVISYRSHEMWIRNDRQYQYNIMMKGNHDEIKEELMVWLEREHLMYSYKMHGDDVFRTKIDSKIQIYCDCYAYDWVLLNDLLFGNALDVPEWFDYIPIDLSSYLLFNNIDPDINRESMVINDDTVNEFNDMIEDAIKHLENVSIDREIKHNSLWDAFVCKRCFESLK